MKLLSRHLLSMIAAGLGILTLGTVMAGCSMNGQEQGIVRIELPRSAQLPNASYKHGGDALQAAISGVEYSVDVPPPVNFDELTCYAINVTGPGIPLDPRLNCSGSTMSFGILGGFVSKEQGVLEVMVPVGSDRRVQLIGVRTFGVGCPSLNELLNLEDAGQENAFSGIGDPYLLGGATVSVYDHTEVMIDASFELSRVIFDGCEREKGYVLPIARIITGARQHSIADNPVPSPEPSPAISPYPTPGPAYNAYPATFIELSDADVGSSNGLHNRQIFDRTTPGEDFLNVGLVEWFRYDGGARPLVTPFDVGSLFVNTDFEIAGYGLQSVSRLLWDLGAVDISAYPYFQLEIQAGGGFDSNGCAWVAPSPSPTASATWTPEPVVAGVRSYVYNVGVMASPSPSPSFSSGPYFEYSPHWKAGRLVGGGHLEGSSFYGKIADHAVISEDSFYGGVSKKFIIADVASNFHSIAGGCGSQLGLSGARLKVLKTLPPLRVYHDALELTSGVVVPVLQGASYHFHLENMVASWPEVELICGIPESNLNVIPNPSPSASPSPSPSCGYINQYTAGDFSYTPPLSWAGPVSVKLTEPATGREAMIKFDVNVNPVEIVTFWDEVEVIGEQSLQSALFYSGFDMKALLPTGEMVSGWYPTFKIEFVEATPGSLPAGAPVFCYGGACEFGSANLVGNLPIGSFSFKFDGIGQGRFKITLHPGTGFEQYFYGPVFNLSGAAATQLAWKTDPTPLPTSCASGAVCGPFTVERLSAVDAPVGPGMAALVVYITLSGSATSYICADSSCLTAVDGHVTIDSESSLKEFWIKANGAGVLDVSLYASGLVSPAVVGVLIN